jgi:hypothetical protein
MNNSVQLTQEHPVPQEFHTPIFFVNLDDCLDHCPNSIVTGTISSTLELENGAQVLLVNDFMNPTLSVYATLQYLSTGLEGIQYQYGYYKTDIGVPSQIV